METTVGRVSELEDEKGLHFGFTIEWIHLALFTPHQELLGEQIRYYTFFFPEARFFFERTDCSCMVEHLPCV